MSLWIDGCMNEYIHHNLRCCTRYSFQSDHHQNRRTLRLLAAFPTRYLIRHKSQAEIASFGHWNNIKCRQGTNTTFRKQQCRSGELIYNGSHSYRCCRYVISNLKVWVHDICRSIWLWYTCWFFESNSLVLLRIPLINMAGHVTLDPPSFSLHLLDGILLSTLLSLHTLFLLNDLTKKVLLLMLSPSHVPWSLSPTRLVLWNSLPFLLPKMSTFFRREGLPRHSVTLD